MHASATIESVQAAPTPQTAAGGIKNAGTEPATPLLHVGMPDDMAEMEAESFADAFTGHSVRRGADLPPAPPEEPGSALKGEPIQPRLSAAIQSHAHGGQSIPARQQSRLREAGMHRAEDISIHTGPSPDSFARNLNADAFTVGNHIFFRDGQYKPETAEGQHLLAHEMAHAASGNNPLQIRRRLHRGQATEDGLVPLVTDANSIQQIVEEITSLGITGYRTVMVFSSQGLTIVDFANRRELANYGLRPGGVMLDDGLWEADIAGGVGKIGFRNGVAVTEARTLDTTHFAPAILEIIRARGSIMFFDDLTMATTADLARHGYLPAIIAVRDLPAGTAASVSPTPQGPPSWASGQVSRLRTLMRVPVVSGAGNTTGTSHQPPPSRRNTQADRQTPERLEVYRQPGTENIFVNVWVGGRGTADGGHHEAVPIHENDTDAVVQARIEAAVARVREQMTRRALEQEARTGVAYNEYSYRGGGDTGAPRANRPSLRATMQGPEELVPNSTGAYTASLHYEDAYPDLLGQVAAAYHGAEYTWQVLNITPLYQQVMRERAAAIASQRTALGAGMPTVPIAETPAERRLREQGRAAPGAGMETVTQFAADRRDLSRRMDNFTEDVDQAAHDLFNPFESQDGSSGAAIRSILVNSFNLSTTGLHGILTLGGWLVRSISGILVRDPAYQREIPFPDQTGFYLVRCVIAPRAIGEGETAIHRLPSVVVKVVEVKEMRQRLQQELDTQRLNAESSLMELLVAFRMAGADALPVIRLALQMKIQEAAQTNRSFLQTQADERQRQLEGLAPDAPQRARIEEELGLLREGLTPGTGLLSHIFSTRLALKRRELEQERARQPYRDVLKIRSLEQEIRVLESRLQTARGRESEFQTAGQAIIRPHAVFINEANGENVPLLIEIGQVAHYVNQRRYGYRLSDMSSGPGDIYEAQGRTRAEAVRNVLSEFAGHFPYGRGYLSVRMPPDNPALHLGITEPVTIRCNPRDTAQASERLEELLQVLAVVGLFIPPVGLAAGAAGAAVAAGRILGRINAYSFEWDMAAVMDVLNIVGAVASGIRVLSGAKLVTARNMFAVVPESEDLAIWVQRLSRFERMVDFIDTSANRVGYMLGTMQTVQEYMHIQQEVAAGRMTHAQARRERASLLMRSMNDHFMQHAPGLIEHFRPNGERVPVPHQDPGMVLPASGTPAHVPAATPDSAASPVHPSAALPQGATVTPHTPAAPEPPARAPARPEGNPQQQLERLLADPVFAGRVVSGDTAAVAQVRALLDARREQARAREARQREEAPPPQTGATPLPEGAPRPAPMHAPDTTPAARARALLAQPDMVQRMLQGDSAALRTLLETHGTWRDLVMMLEADPNPINQEVVARLGAYRQRIVEQLRQLFGLDLSDRSASTQPGSDIDLATAGSDAGRRMVAAEAWMRHYHGPEWSEMLRMNFYTVAERLFMYEQVRHLITDPRQFAAMQEHFTARSEVLNFAKMLQHAGGHPESTARVEMLMAHLNDAQKAEVRRLAAETPQVARETAAMLHRDIDTLATLFDSLATVQGNAIPTGMLQQLPATLPPHLRAQLQQSASATELRVNLARVITEMQMEANFRTVEAYISPGAGRQVVREVAVTGHEAYQSLLANLEMMEHAIHANGNDVSRAVQEYEMYKYISRFIVAYQLAGLQPNAFMLAYYQAAHDIYRIKNERQSLQGVGRRDLSYINAMHRQFMAQVAADMPALRQGLAQRGADWNPDQRSLIATRGFVFDTRIVEGGRIAQPPAAATAPLTIGSIVQEGGRQGIRAIAHVPVVRVPQLPGNETRARFEGGRLRLELGERAGHQEILQHLETLRVLQRYEGALGLIRRLFSRIGEALGGSPAFGRRGFEAGQELPKLFRIRQDLEAQRAAVEQLMLQANNQTELAALSQHVAEMTAAIQRIEAQTEVHRQELDSLQPGRGFVAMQNTLPVITESNARFYSSPNVGETIRYRDRGGTEGWATQLSATTIQIITRLGQTTTRADYQRRSRPTDFGLPVGRHGFEALHAIGPGVGHESPQGIYFGPWRVNQLIQRVGIESFIAACGAHLQPGKTVYLRVEVEKVTRPWPQSDGTVRQVDFLKSITYQFYGQSPDHHRNRIFSLGFSVARPDDPVSRVNFHESDMEFFSRFPEFIDFDAVSDHLRPEFFASDPINETP